MGSGMSMLAGVNMNTGMGPGVGMINPHMFVARHKQ